jgi:hypothetical protein
MHTTLTHTQRPLRLQSSGDLHDAPPLFNPAQNALAAMASMQKLSRAHIVQCMSHAVSEGQQIMSIGKLD